MKNVEVFEREPMGFQCKIVTAGCYVERGGRLLLLQNAKGDSEEGKWGVPGGKVEKGELPIEGAVRELSEEAGIVVRIEDLVEVGALFVRKPGIEYVFHMFFVKGDRDGVRLSGEHAAFRWAGEDEVRGMELMDGAVAAYEAYRRFRSRVGIGRTI